MDELITIREACELCHASEKALRDAIMRGELSVYLAMEKNPRKGSHRPVKHIKLLELEAWLATGKGRRGKSTGARTA